MSSTPPPRIAPFYEVPQNLEDTEFLPPEAAELQQDGKTFTGTLRIVQQWAPLMTLVEFTTTPPVEFEFGDAHVKSAKIDADIGVAVITASGVRGLPARLLEIGSDHKLDRVTFHLPNYPDVFGGSDYNDTITDGKKTTSIRWSEVILEDDGWRITIQPHRNIHNLRRDAQAGRAIVLSGVGEIRRAHGSQFNKKHVRPVLDALRVFLSFSFAEWMPPMFVVGSNAVVEKSWQKWANYDVTSQWYSRGWLDELHGQDLAKAYPGFCALWKKEGWQAPIEQTVGWLIEASRRSGGTEGAIAFGQIPLEMLAWLIFVEGTPILDDAEFDKLSAANKMQLMLAQCGIPLDVPPALKASSTVARAENKTGPRLASDVRNTIIHPNKKNREKLPEWERTHKVKADELLWESQQLFKWYITLVLLRLMDYRGTYANRLTSHKYGAVEPVPWASATS